MIIDLTKIIAFTKRHKLILLLTLFYFIFRLINLTTLPVFNDESIYLNWGWREIHVPGQLFYSLFDSKQPLLMWIFGIFESIFSDAVFAGRFASTLTGFLAFVGIYKLTKEIAGRNAALVAGLIYTVIPIFSFFDRQALMESAIGTVGVWTCYFIVKFFEFPTTKRTIFLGIILGLGIFIKSTSFVFLVVAILIILSSARKIRGINGDTVVVGIIKIVLAATVVDFLLFLQPLFWETFSTNDRYTFKLSELLQFPIATWITNIRAFFEIGFFYLTPLLFFAGLIGIFLLIKQKKTAPTVVSLWFLLTIFSQIILVKSSTQRYLVSFLPPLCVFASIFFTTLYQRAKQRTIVLCFASCLIAFLITVEQIVLPDAYFYSFAKLTNYSMLGYMSGFTSGYKLDEVYQAIDNVASYRPVIVGVAENSGNPEDAIFIHYQKSNRVFVTYLDGRFMGDLSQIDCLASPITIYFVSRGAYLTGLEKFLDKATEIHLSNGTDYIGVWTLKNPCSGRTVNLNFQQN